eukprot:SAG11_NODE_435_length_9493_cov_21.529806_3_plen_674_part_00
MTETMTSPLDCQARCFASAFCTHFSYEWELTDGAMYHECYLKSEYEDASCMVNPYVPWGSEDSAWHGQSGPGIACASETELVAACESFIGMDYGGNPSYVHPETSEVISCGYAPIVEIIADHADWPAPSWYSGDLTIDPELVTPFECQALCFASEDCDYFSYEWELTDGGMYHECYLKSEYEDANCMVDPYVPWGSEDSRWHGQSGPGIECGTETSGCPPVFLGPDIGYQNVMEYHDDDGSCTISMNELAAVCTTHFESCMAFIDGDDEPEEVPMCPPVFLGPDIGFQNVMEFHDEDGSCDISMNELAAVCSHHFEECMAFLGGDPEPELPTCPPVFLGPDIGFQNVMEYHDDDGSCTISMAELAAVCTTHFDSCTAFLDGEESEPEPEPEPEMETCPPVFLGPDIGFQNVMEYHDDDGSCTISMAELAAVCTTHFESCIAFLGGDDEPETPTCPPVFLGPDIGFQNVMEYHDDDGSCTISMNELAAVCTTHFESCMAFLNNGDEPEECTSSVCGSVDTVSTDGPGTTYQLILTLSGDAANVYTIYGTEGSLMSIPASYHEAAPFGANTGGVNPAFLSVVTDAAFDGWLTVGITDGDTDDALSSIGIDWDGWTADAGISTDNGAVFWMSPDDGPTGSAVVAQFTTSPGWEATLGAQGRSTSGADWQADISFSG